ncbi:hypothetical protein [Nostoc commune]|uniref:hypothetical protein n=1 Tax=Nostoc commune TaxID=1178 RepID=UPI0018C75EEE|nr:hypothetical protein [Nostoc commune]MBG1262314.1 hypothetical protein [Nostoc commune BAE]
MKTATFGGGVNKYYADLSSIYPVGTQVDWMVRVVRSNIKNQPGLNYYWAFHNPKFAQPDFNPSSTSNQFEYFTASNCSDFSATLHTSSAHKVEKCRLDLDIKYR